MKKSNSQAWVAMPKGAAAEFSKIRRPYSKIEALFSYSLDLNCGKVRSCRDYSRMWTWSRDKTKLFFLQHGENRPQTGHKPATNQPRYNVISLENKDASGHKPATNRPQTGHKYKEQEQEQHNKLLIKTEKKKSKTASEEQSKSGSAVADRPYSKEFLSFWKRYPNKRGKAKAFTAWKRHKCGNGIFDKIMGSLEQYIQSEEWQQDGGKYIPHGSTWVSQMRWEDDLAEEQGGLSRTPEQIAWVKRNLKQLKQEKIKRAQNV